MRSSSRIKGTGSSSSSYNVFNKIFEAMYWEKRKTCHDVSQTQRNAMIRSKIKDRTEHAIMHHGPDQI